MMMKHDHHHHSEDNGAEMLLFPFWKISTSFGVFVSCLVILCASFLLEFIRWNARSHSIVRKSNKISTLSETIHKESTAESRTAKQKVHFLGLVLHSIELTISYSLMMIFMTMNFWLCSAVILGQSIARMAFDNLM